MEPVELRSKPLKLRLRRSGKYNILTSLKEQR